MQGAGKQGVVQPGAVINNALLQLVSSGCPPAILLQLVSLLRYSCIYIYIHIHLHIPGAAINNALLQLLSQACPPAILLQAGVPPAILLHIHIYIYRHIHIPGVAINNAPLSCSPEPSCNTAAISGSNVCHRKFMRVLAAVTLFRYRAARYCLSVDTELFSYIYIYMSAVYVYCKADMVHTEAASM